MHLTKRKRTRVKFNPGLSANRPSNNWAQVWGKKILPKLNHPYPAPPQTSNGQVNHLGGGGRNRLDTLVNVIHQQNGWRTFIMWWFSRLKFAFQDLQYVKKRHKWREKVQKNPLFPRCGQTKAFRYEIQGRI